MGTLLLAAALLAAPAELPVTPAVHLENGLAALRGGDTAAAHAELLLAFLLDPELPAPPSDAVDAARAEAIATLKERLADAATRATAVFTAPAPRQPLSEGSTAEPPPLLPPRDSEPAVVQRPPEKERPLAAGGRLTVGGYGFYVIGESRGGPAVELAFGGNVGRFRIGGAASLLLGTSLAMMLGARISTTSTARLAYLAAFDLGLFYGGSNAIFAPYVTLHAAGLRLKAGRVGFELHLASLSIFWLGGTTFRFVPGAGVAVLL